jgi:5,10-methylenetetrahydrofolate reductase/CO dehydrogenase/acetyl-CoA synthase delta subunit
VIAGSNLEQVLRSGQFAVTGELGPPKTGDPEVVREKARILKGHVDAVNITDCQTAIVRMSSLSAGLLALAEGVEPVMQMTCRDRNRIGIQSDILGASALGIKNLLCLTGDHQKFGNHPQAKGVFDMDSIQMLGMVRGMRDGKVFQCGEAIKDHEPRLFLGAAANPFADPFEYRPARLGKKVSAGADFIQTQIIYNIDRFERFMERVRDLGLHEKVHILAGVTPPKSLGMARYMKEFVPGLDVTDAVIERMKDAKDRREEGINICVDIIQQVRDIPGVAGVHIMAIGWEEAVPEIVKRAGLAPRPEVRGVEPVLTSSAALKSAKASARQEAESAVAKQLADAGSEAKASRELVVKEKERAASEIADLKDRLDTAEAQVRAARAGISIEPVSAPQAAGGTAAEGRLSPREQRALGALHLGLDSLRKVLGLSEDQFESLRHFIEAEFVLQVALAQAPAAVDQLPVAEMEHAGTPPAEVLQAATEEDARRKQVVGLIAKGSVLLQRRDAPGAVKAFEEALALAPDDEKAKAGLARAKATLEEERPSPGAEGAPTEGLPPRPPEFTEEQWRTKGVIRLIAKGSVLLQRRDAPGAVKAFEEALALAPDDEKAKAGLARAKAGDLGPGPEGTAPAKEEPKPVEAPVAEVAAPVPPPPKEAVAPPQPAVEAPKPTPRPAQAETTTGTGVAELPKETVPLAARAGSIAADTFVEPCAGKIREVVLGEGEKAVTVGGSSTLPLHLFEGDMPNSTVIAWEVMDTQPEEWPDVLTRHYADVLTDPVAWARKCVNTYGAKAICLSLASTDPNGLNRPSSEAAKVAQSVVEGVDVPVILWGCGNADKDTETLREVTGLIGTRRVCIGPLTEANYRSLGATALAFHLPVVASSPIDVNLAKQLNILLENLGVSLDSVLVDPAIGALGYGLEYTYSVMERIRLAALTQQDEKLQVPFICNLGREVWKAKECRLPSDAILGDQERRGVLMEAITALNLLMVGGEVLIMRHPTAIALTQAMIHGMT